MSQHLLIKSFTPIGGQVQELGTLNVFVGPNNTGKSETLRDLGRLAGNFEPTAMERAKGEEPKTRVIQDLAFVGKLTMERFLRGMTVYDTGAAEGTIAQGIGPDLRSPYRRQLPLDLKNVLFRPVITARSAWATSFGELLPLRVAYLPAEGRSRLVEPAAAAHPLRAPEHLLAALQDADAAIHTQFETALATIFDGMKVRLDTTERVQLSLRVLGTSVEPLGNAMQNALTFGKLKPLHLEGEGLKHCAAIVLTMLLCQGRAILLDNPEADLHPDVSRRLGAWIAESAAPLGCQVFVVTRDPAFLTGLFTGSSDVSIWRLTRREAVTRFEPVPIEVGRALATFPLFSTQQALACLLRDGVVVTPECSDRIVFQTVAERLLRVHNLGYIQSQGGRNLTFVTKAMRRANLPTCVVAELDLFQNESTFSELVKALSNAPPPTPWLATRERLVSHVEGWFDGKELAASAQEVETFLDQIKKGQGPTAPPPASSVASNQPKWDRLRRERLSILPLELRIWVEELLEDLKRIGLFVSPKGRIESWISFTADAEDPGGWMNRAMQMLHSGDCPAELRAFTAELTGQLRASGTTSRTTRTGHGT